MVKITSKTTTTNPLGCQSRAKLRMNSTITRLINSNQNKNNTKYSTANKATPDTLPEKPHGAKHPRRGSGAGVLSATSLAAVYCVWL